MKHKAHKTHKTYGWVKSLSVAFAVYTMGSLVIPTASLASSRTNGYNECHKWKHIAIGAVGTGILILGINRKHRGH